MNLANALAAAAAAHAAGAHLHDIRAGLRSFTTSYEVSPGRLNLFELNGFRVLLDYCHNVAGMRMLGDFVERLAEPPPGGDIVAHRRIGVVASPGDRRDRDIRELGEAAAAHFDVLIVREDVNPRGRERGATAELLAAGAAAAMRQGARCRTVEVVPDELEAARLALDRANPGDLVVVCADRVETVVHELQARQLPRRHGD
jgi:cyanophycin synthetase